MTRVAFVLQEPTPYRTPHLQTVADRDALDVTIVYAARTVQRRRWAVPEPSERVIYLDGITVPATRLLQHDYAFTLQIWPLLTKLRPEVVVIGGWSLMATQLAILWARAHRVPYVLMSDNHLLEPRPGWIRFLKHILLRFVVPPAAAWLVPGSLGREYLESYGAEPSRIVRFPLTVDIEALSAEADARRARRDELRSELDIPEAAVAVLHVGRLVPQKAVDVLARAVAHARLRRPELHLVVVGSGPEEAALRALVETLEVPTTFVDFVEHDSLTDVYVAVDIFALLSNREPWGVVVNEAAAAGLPLVLSRNVGAAGDLLDEDNGFAVTSGDIGATADALVTLAGDPGMRERFGAHSKDLVRSWGYAESVDELEKLVTEIVA
jgi:glycosyltransferase involved in cell wall biosynthesis